MKCVASGDNEANIKWLIGGSYVPSNSTETIYSNDQVISQLQLKLTGLFDEQVHYNCVKLNFFLLICTTKVSCHAERQKGNEVRRDLEIQHYFGKN